MRALASREGVEGLRLESASVDLGGLAGFNAGDEDAVEGGAVLVYLGRRLAGFVSVARVE